MTKVTTTLPCGRLRFAKLRLEADKFRYVRKMLVTISYAKTHFRTPRLTSVYQDYIEDDDSDNDTALQPLAFCEAAFDEDRHAVQDKYAFMRKFAGGSHGEGAKLSLSLSLSY